MAYGDIYIECNLGVILIPYLSVETKSAQGAYYNYLTEIENGKPNIVIDFAVGIISEALVSKSRISVADIGCFNGGMLNEISKRIGSSDRNRVGFHGYDTNIEMLTEGQSRFPHITFLRHDIALPDEMPHCYDLVIVSNVLHEVYSGFLPNRTQEGRKMVEASLSALSEGMNERGLLLLMDGLMPDSPERPTIVRFENNALIKLLKEFALSNFIIPISYEEEGDGVHISMKDLAAFLTKARYLHRGFWSLESQQVYQYFTREDFELVLQNAGLNIVEFLPQELSPEIGIKIIDPTNVSIPAKNVLILSQKQ